MLCCQHMSTQPANEAPTKGRFYERKSRPYVEAVRWTGDNWDEVREWLAPRVSEVKLLDQRPYGGAVAIVVDGEAYRCVTGGWFVETHDPPGLPPYGVRVVSGPRFEQLYGPTDPSGVLAEKDIEGLGASNLMRQALQGADKVLDDLRAALQMVPPGGASVPDAPAWLIRLHRAACEVAGIEVRERAPSVVDTSNVLLWEVYRCSSADPDRACGIRPVGVSDDRKDLFVVADTNNEECCHGILLGNAHHIVDLHNLSIADPRKDDDLAETKRREGGEPVFRYVNPPPMEDLVVEACARVANDVFAVGAGDMPSWDSASPDQKATARASVRALLAGRTPEQWHKEWVDEKRKDGWLFGDVKDDERKRHPNIRPYRDLPAEQRMLDDMFVAAVRATRTAIAMLTVELEIGKACDAPPMGVYVVKGPPHDMAADMKKCVDAIRTMDMRPITVDNEATTVVPVLGRDRRQALVVQWARECFGDMEAFHVQQRALRVLEEAVELAQACGVTAAIVAKLAAYVYGRPVGGIYQEIGGLSITLLALAGACGLSAEEEERREFDRIMEKPRSYFTDRNARKNADGIKAVES